MNKLKRSFSLRSSKRHIPESVRPHVWENDSYKVRNGGVSFPVKYVGFIEVSESRGTQVCAEAFRRMKEAGTSKKKRMQLLVTADCVRVVDEETKSLVIDQTIEKVSFCTPDPSNDRVFSYICRDGTTRRWMCHCFIAIRDTGERLSHAVGCAFTACLQRKQKAQALQQAHKEAQSQQQQLQGQQQPPQQLPQQPPQAAEVAAAATTAPLVNGTSPPTQSQQQYSPGLVVSTAPIPASTPVAPTPGVPSSSDQNGTIPGTTQQSAQVQQSVNPVLKPPPSVARPRPQAFNPSPFTRHMSLRYRSNPLSFMPLRGDSAGYETLAEEAAVPQLPPSVDTLMLPNNSPAAMASSSSFGATVLKTSAPLNNVVSQKPVINGYGTNSSLSTTASGAFSLQNKPTNVQLNNTAPFQPLGVQSSSVQTNGVGTWGVPAPQQRQRQLSDAEMWLASAAAADTPVSTTSTLQSNQGLLTTVNPFAETASQVNALSSAWTRDLQGSLPNATSHGTPLSPWAPSSSHATNGEDEFSSFFATREVSPTPVSKKDNINPFSPSNQEQVFWV